MKSSLKGSKPFFSAKALHSSTLCSNDGKADTNIYRERFFLMIDSCSQHSTQQQKEAVF